MTSKPTVYMALGSLAVLWLMFTQFSPGASAGTLPALTTSQIDEHNRRHQEVSFADLGAFVYNPRLPPKVEAAQREKGDSIPPSIRALDGRDVRIDGFMLPLDVDGSGVAEFILNANYDMCAFGAPAVINQQVRVRVAGGLRAGFTHMPVRVFGRFEVGEAFENGRVGSIYRMTATAVASRGL